MHTLSTIFNIRHMLLYSLEKFIGYLRLVWLPELAKRIGTNAGRTAACTSCGETQELGHDEKVKPNPLVKTAASETTLATHCGVCNRFITYTKILTQRVVSDKVLRILSVSCASHLPTKSELIGFSHVCVVYRSVIRYGPNDKDVFTYCSVVSVFSIHRTVNTVAAIALILCRFAPISAGSIRVQEMLDAAKSNPRCL
jgi:hypothetical protein